MSDTPTTSDQWRGAGVPDETFPLERRPRLPPITDDPPGRDVVPQPAYEPDPHYREGDGRPRINRYTCQHVVVDRSEGVPRVVEKPGCGRFTITRDRDDGTTPAQLRCDCGGTQYSAWYRVPQDLVPVAEWYRPADDELASLPRVVREHVAQGGLVLRSLLTGKPAITTEQPTAPRRVGIAGRMASLAAALTTGRVNQGRAFVKRARRSDARRRLEKASRKRNRRR